MSIKSIITRGFGATIGTIKDIVTRGFTSGLSQDTVPIDYKVLDIYFEERQSIGFSERPFIGFEERR